MRGGKRKRKKEGKGKRRKQGKANLMLRCFTCWISLHKTLPQNVIMKARSHDVIII